MAQERRCRPAVARFPPVQHPVKHVVREPSARDYPTGPPLGQSCSAHPTSCPALEGPRCPRWTNDQCTRGVFRPASLLPSVAADVAPIHVVIALRRKGDMPALAPIDENFFDTAPVRFAATWQPGRNAKEVWQDLTDGPLHWCRGLTIRWTSPEPFGVGTTRRAGILGALQADERFFLWEEGHRQAFSFTHTNLTLFRRGGEYYEVEPTGPGTCRFTWKFAVEPTPAGRLGNGGTKLLVTSLFRDTTRYFGTPAVSRSK